MVVRRIGYKPLSCLEMRGANPPRPLASGRVDHYKHNEGGPGVDISPGLSPDHPFGLAQVSIFPSEGTWRAEPL